MITWTEPQQQNHSLQTASTENLIHQSYRIYVRSGSRRRLSRARHQHNFPSTKGPAPGQSYAVMRMDRCEKDETVYNTKDFCRRYTCETSHEQKLNQLFWCYIKNKNQTYEVLNDKNLILMRSKSFLYDFVFQCHHFNDNQVTDKCGAHSSDSTWRQQQQQQRRVVPALLRPHSARALRHTGLTITHHM